MVLVLEEKVKSDFQGTIIDIETIGDFNRNFSDSRQYAQIAPVIFGFIDCNGLKIYCARSIPSVEKLRSKTRDLLLALEKPFYAFNSHFEKGVLFHNLGERVEFERELNSKKFEAKKRAVKELDIQQYDDPFNDNGLLCKYAWEKGNLGDAMAHNRACLLKEKDILLKRGFREPEPLELVGK